MLLLNKFIRPRIYNYDDFYVDFNIGNISFSRRNILRVYIAITKSNKPYKKYLFNDNYAIEYEVMVNNYYTQICAKHKKNYKICETCKTCTKRKNKNIEVILYLCRDNIYLYDKYQTYNVVPDDIDIENSIRYLMNDPSYVSNYLLLHQAQ